MAREINKIDIRIGDDDNRKLSFPEKVEVPVGSIVQWNILNINEAYDVFVNWSDGLIFTIYFSGESPFSWKRQFIQPLDLGFRLSPFPKIVRLAEDVVDIRGDYKYGISVTSATTGKIIYDDDPFLKVF